MQAYQETSGSLFLFLLVVGDLVYNTQYPMDTWTNPGPAVFPLIVGGIFTLLALAHLVRGVMQGKGARRPERDGPRAGSLKPGLRGGLKSKVSILIVLLILYLLLMKAVGFHLSNLLFVAVSSRLIGARDWTRPLALALGIDLFCYLLFEAWLKVSLPKSLIF
jgi:hypothetical protein